MIENENTSSRAQLLKITLGILLCGATIYFHYIYQWGWGFSVILLLIAGIAGLIVTERTTRNKCTDNKGGGSDREISADATINETHLNMNKGVYTLMLTDPGSDPVAVLRLLQNQTSLSSSKAKSLLVNKKFPARIAYGSKMKIEGFAKKFQHAGAKIKVAQ